MDAVRKNIAANLVGRSWNLLSIYLFVPFYLRFLGVEAYGLVGFYTTLQAVVALADFGLTAALTREMARLSIQTDSSERLRDLLKTIELLYGGLAILVVVIVESLAGFLAHHWLISEALPGAVVEHAVRAMGVAVALQFLASLYLGGLLGLQRQVGANIIQMLVGILRGGGAVIVLWLISSTIDSFLLWQVLSNLLLLLLYRGTLFRGLPRCPTRPVFRAGLLKGVLPYASGMAVISINSIVLMQLDKIMISKMLPLSFLGYYTIASALSQAPLVLSASIANAIFPRLTQHLARQDEAALASDYHRFSRLLSILVFPVGLTLVFFSKEAIALWTQSPESASRASAVASLLLLGSLALAVEIVPFNLALAAAYTRLAIVIGLVATALIVPIQIILIRQLGLLGGGVSWLLLNVCSAAAFIVLLHRKLLRGQLRPWFANDLVRPLLPAVVCVAVVRLAVPSESGTVVSLFAILLSCVLAFLCSALWALKRPWNQLAQALLARNNSHDSLG